MNIIKPAFIFLTGAATGAALAYFFTKDNFRREANRYAEAEIRDMENYFISKYANTPKEKAEGQNNALKYETEGIDISEIGASSIEYVERPKQVAYNHATELEEDEFDEDFDVDAYIERDHPRDDPPEEPYPITPYQFNNEHSDYDKLYLYYYAGNNTLVDKEDELIDNWNIFGGRQMLKRFGEFEEGVVHARNDKLAADFEIVRKRGSFTETVTSN